MDLLVISSSVLSSLTAAHSLTMSMIDMHNVKKNSDLYLSINELSKNLYIAIQEIDKLNKNLYIKDKEIEELKRIISIKDSIVWNLKLPYIKKDDELEGPYCANCWQVDEKMILLQQLGNGCYQCTNCKNLYDPEATKRSNLIHKPRRLA